MTQETELFTAPARLIKSVTVGHMQGDPDKVAAVVAFHPSMVVDGGLTYGDREEETVYGREAVEAVMKEAEEASAAMAAMRAANVILPTASEV